MLNIKISNEVYSCLVNQALAMKLDSKESSDDIARKIVEEYFRNDDLTFDEEKEFISMLNRILKD